MLRRVKVRRIVTLSRVNILRKSKRRQLAFEIPVEDVDAPGGRHGRGWMADRMGRKTPLMISIIWYSVCNFIAGFSPSFAFLFFFRALLGIGMGAEWPAGAALAMESWPARSRGFMSGVLQGSWGLGFALSSLAYGFLYAPFEAMGKGYGWRGMLILGVLPALACVWIRFYVKEPEVWAENQRIQTETKQEVKLPLLAIFKPAYLWNTITGCVWMAANFCVYYSIWALFSTYLQKELGWTPLMVATRICSSRLNDGFAVQDSTNCPICIGTPSCCGANDGSNASEQIGSPLGTESTCNFAVCGCGPQFPLAAIVIRWNVRMLQKGEKVAAHLAVTFAQPLAVLVGGCQHHDRVQLAIQPALIGAPRGVS